MEVEKPLFLRYLEDVLAETGPTNRDIFQLGIWEGTSVGPEIRLLLLLGGNSRLPALTTTSRLWEKGSEICTQTFQIATRHVSSIYLSFGRPTSLIS